MVVGHSVCPEILSNFVYLFHMPLFFFCSGIFFTQPTSHQSLSTFINKKIKKLYIPFITWSLLFLVVHNLFLHFNIYYHEETYIYHITDYAQKVFYILFTMSYQEPIIFQFWFLKQLLLSSSLIGCILFFLYNRGININKYHLLWILLLFTILFKRFHIILPIIGDISLLLLGATFFYIGFLYKQISSCITFSSIRGWICVLILALIAWHVNSKIEMLNYTYKNILLYCCSALIGIYMVFCFSKYLGQYAIRKYLFFIGNHTMVILIWHLLAFRLASFIKATIWGYPIERIGDYKLIAEHNEFFWIIYTLIGLGGPLFSYYLITKLSKIFYRN